MILWDSSGRGRARAEGVYSNSCFEPFFAADASLPLPNSVYKVVLAIHTMADSGGHFMAKTTLSEDRRRAETAEAGRYSNHHHRRNGREGGRDPGEEARGGGEGKNEEEDAALKIGSKRAPSGRTRKARTQEGIPSCLTWYVPCKVARERDGKALAPSSSSRLSAREREILKLTHAPLPFRTFCPPPPPDSCKARG